jgi:hypothetical protein
MMIVNTCNSDRNGIGGDELVAMLEWKKKKK